MAWIRDGLVYRESDFPKNLGDFTTLVNDAVEESIHVPVKLGVKLVAEHKGIDAIEDFYAGDILHSNIGAENVIEETNYITKIFSGPWDTLDAKARLFHKGLRAYFPDQLSQGFDALGLSQDLITPVPDIVKVRKPRAKKSG